MDAELAEAKKADAATQTDDSLTNANSIGKHAIEQRMKAWKQAQ